MIWLEFVVVLAAIVIGARVGGAGLGTVAALGLAVLVFGFGLPPSSPPVAVLAILVSVISFNQFSRTATRALKILFEYLKNDS